MSEFAELGIGLEFTVNDPDAIVEHVGTRIFERVTAWLVPTGTSEKPDSHRWWWQR